MTLTGLDEKALSIARPASIASLLAGSFFFIDVAAAKGARTPQSQFYRDLVHRSDLDGGSDVVRMCEQIR